MNQKELFRLLPLIGLMLSPLLSQGQDDKWLPDVEGHRIDRESYVMIWDSALRLPKIIAYEVTREELEVYDCGGARYHTDPDLNEFNAKDYEGASDLGFEKGHLVPVSHGSWNDASCSHTSLYSNILPQSKILNHGAWYDSEELIGSLAKEFGKVYVHLGPLPYSVDTLPSGMPVPIGFWKLLIYEQDDLWIKECFLFSHSDNLIVNLEEGWFHKNGANGFADKGMAEEIAKLNGCSEVFALDEYERTWYFPCRTPDSFSKVEVLRAEHSCDDALLSEILEFKVHRYSEWDWMFTFPKYMENVSVWATEAAAREFEKQNEIDISAAGIDLTTESGLTQLIYKLAYVSKACGVVSKRLSKIRYENEDDNPITAARNFLLDSIPNYLEGIILKHLNDGQTSD